MTPPPTLILFLFAGPLRGAIHALVPLGNPTARPVSTSVWPWAGINTSSIAYRSWPAAILASLVGIFAFDESNFILSASSCSEMSDSYPSSS